MDMTRVLGIMGSPRKRGNTHLLLERVLAGAESAGAETGLVLLGDIDIRECTGCHSCWRTGSCAIADGMNGIFPRIAEADVIVFGTPVYWFACSGLMKLFIDRLVYFNGPDTRQRIKGKRAAVVIPFEDTAEETVRPVIEFFDSCFRYMELVPAGRLVAPGVTVRGEVAEDEALIALAEEMGKGLVG
jgi:multimeric flavodoxin WrbA